MIIINKSSLFALVKTHASEDHSKRICKLTNYDKSFVIEADCFSGGIWHFWKCDEVLVRVINNNSQHVTVEISKAEEEPWPLSIIYASPHLIKRANLWVELTHMATLMNKSWLLMGDFNETHSLDERRGVVVWICNTDAPTSITGSRTMLSLILAFLHHSTPGLVVTFL